MVADKNFDFREGLTPELRNIFERVSFLDCVKGLYLCGGTGQSIQMNHRLSEDLDFELLGKRRDRPGLDFSGIMNEVKSVFPDARTEILGNDHFLMYVTGQNVKLFFYRPVNPVKYINVGFSHNNIETPSLQDLLGMKLFTICTRTKTRDFYDIYCLLKEGCNFREGISYASFLSRRGYRSKEMMSKLLAPQLYPINDEFLKLRPRYDVSSEEMRDYFGTVIEREAKACAILKGELSSKKGNGHHF